MHVRSRRDRLERACALVVLGVWGCALPAVVTPPLETEELTQTVKLSDLWTGSALLGPVKAKIPVPKLPPSLFGFGPPYVKVPLGTEDGAAIAVPEQARKAPITNATLVLSTTNQMAIPLTLRIFLAQTKPYSTDSDPGVLAMAAAGQPGDTARIEKSLDTSLFGADKVRLGIGATSSGSAGVAVDVSSEDTVTAKAKVVFQLKLL